MIHSSIVNPVRWSYLLIILALPGCGGNSAGPVRAEVQGTVSLDSKMLQSGVIRFIPIGDQQGPAAGAPIKDGVYTLSKEDGPIVGPHRVEIVATNYLGFSIDDEEAMHAYLQKHRGRLPPNPVPKVYNVSSSLTADIADGVDNEFDFNLESRPGNKLRASR